MILTVKTLTDWHDYSQLYAVLYITKFTKEVGIDYVYNIRETSQEYHTRVGMKNLRLIVSLVSLPKINRDELQNL